MENRKIFIVLLTVVIIGGLLLLARKPLPVSPLPQNQSVFVTFHASPPMRIATPSGMTKEGAFTPTVKSTKTSPEL